jgi:hypothetical protein
VYKARRTVEEAESARAGAAGVAGSAGAGMAAGTCDAGVLRADSATIVRWMPKLELPNMTTKAVIAAPISTIKISGRAAAEKMSDAG